MGTYIKNQNKNGVSYTYKEHFGRKENGGYLWKKFTGKSKAAAKRKCDEFKLKYGYASKSQIAKEIFSDYIINWGERTLKNSVKETTYSSFINTVNSRISKYPLGFTQMAQIDINIIQNHINALTDAGYSRATIIKTYRNIKKCLEDAVDNGDVQKINFQRVKLPIEEKVKTKRKDIQAFSLEDVEKIKTELNKVDVNGNPLYQYKNEILFLLNTGLRCGEALALTWDKVNLEEKEIYICQTASIIQTKDEYSKKKTKEVISTPKTKNSNRQVTLNVAAYNALLEIQKKNEGHTKPSDRVFLSKKFTPVNKRNLNRFMGTLTKNAGTNLQTSGLHVLRHTFATVAIAKGNSLSYISKQLGHANENTTRQFYISYLPEIKSKDEEKFKTFKI